MRIAFDLDNTLLHFQYQFPLETSNLGFLRRFLGIEPIRKGFVELFQILKSINIRFGFIPLPTDQYIISGQFFGCMEST